MRNLTKVNYVFGPNGSGKTTIFQILSNTANYDSHVEWVSGVRTVKVYNRTYVRNAFTQAEERGVFLLGEGSKETFDRTKELQDKLQKADQKRHLFQGEIDREHQEIDEKRKELSVKIWERRSDIPEVIRREMTGLNGNRNRCLELTLEKAVKFPERGEETFESLAPKAEIAFSKELKEQSFIPSVPNMVGDEEEMRKALNTPIIGSADVPLADMIERLGISDWVREGVEHLHNPD